MTDSLDSLVAAAKAGEVVIVVYHGGHQPGTKRRIVPIRCTEREMRARDVLTQETKTFLLDKIEVVPESFDAPWYDPAVADEGERINQLTLFEALRPHVAELEELGWSVTLDETSVGVHKRFKNGQPQKSAKAGILDRTADGFSGRPWYVFGPSLASARTYADLSKAVSLFLQEARDHAPS